MQVKTGKIYTTSNGVDHVSKCAALKAELYYQLRMLRPEIGTEDSTRIADAIAENFDLIKQVLETVNDE